MKRIKYKYRNAHLEAYFWLIALFSLAITPPDDATHYSFCLFKNLGFDFCPGCGLGHAITFLFHGQFLKSWQAHPLGIIAIIMLLTRSIKILHNDIHFSPQTKYYE